MKKKPTITVKRGGYGDPEEMTIFDFFGNLSGHDYDNGAVEAASATGNNLIVALGRLAEILVEKKILTTDEVFYIVKGYNE